MPRYVIEEAKLDRYLLDPFHPEGGPKCKLFLRFGFRIDAPTVLANALIGHAEEHRAAARLRVKTGLTKRVVGGPLSVPNGARPYAISVWQLISGDRERLITAYIREA